MMKNELQLAREHLLVSQMALSALRAYSSGYIEGTNPERLLRLAEGTVLAALSRVWDAQQSAEQIGSL